MRDRLLFYIVWSAVLGAAVIGGYYVAERIVAWLTAALHTILGG